MRLQKRAGHALDGVLDVVGQCRMSDVRWWFVRVWCSVHMLGMRAANRK
jgi:hypothetical protein